MISLYGDYMDGDVLGGNLKPDIETLVDSLLSWQEDAVYQEGLNSLGVLEMLLKGSGDIWGAVDWEAGTCDFGGSLFARILEASKRYGDDSGHNRPGLLEREYYNLYLYKDRAVREEEGLAEVGTMFDDGCYAEVVPYCEFLTVNANSAHKDGAWEFISFLLGKEAQEAGGTYMAYPVSKGVFEGMMEKEQEECRQARASDSWKYREASGYRYLTDNRAEELKEALENARFLPLETGPILNIIYEEAQGYFEGSKDLGDVTALIENRVQLYLDEIR